MYTLTQRTLLPPILLLALTAQGCVERPSQDPCDFNTKGYALDAFCTAQVQEYGERDIETDYLPKVVACENGAADFTALQAQAVSARSYLYYKLETSGSIAPTTADQAYGCNRQPGPEHYEAVSSTAGQVLMYDNQVVAAFYVAGSIPSDRISCIAVPGDNDYSSTEHYVTYNQGRSGNDIDQTTLGWVQEGFARNRGCASQNGAHCLSEAGWQYQDILRFYYGEDIQIVTAEGECIDPVDPNECDIEVRGDEPTIIDEVSDCFIRSCNTGDWWWDHNRGYGDQSITTYTVDSDERDCYGRWKLNITTSGEYLVEIYAEDVFNLSNQARYIVRHADGDDVATVGQSGANGWVELGTWSFTEGQEHFIELADNTGEPYTGDNSTRIVFDAIRLRPPPDPPEEDAGGGGEDTGSGEDTGGGEDTGTPDTGHNNDASSEPDVPTGDTTGGNTSGTSTQGNTSGGGSTTPTTSGTSNTSGPSSPNNDDGRLGFTPSTGESDGCSTVPTAPTRGLSYGWLILFALGSLYIRTKRST